MDSLLFTEKSMNYLISNLTQVQADQCSDEFLTILNKLIGVATELSVLVTSKREEVASRQKRRLTNTSSSSDDVRCVSADIETVQVDSDSEESIFSIGSSMQNPSTSLDAQSETVIEIASPSIRLKRMDLTVPSETGSRRCAVKLRRVDMTLESMRTPKRNDDSGPSQTEKKKATPVKRQRKDTKYYFKIQMPKGKKKPTSK
ncbi:uncharacterized protein LOC119069353 isoform X2 [Bradysia coprophila]|uniref:uncharacterized protein LOC119069353 isoform X2 n=1 Tax=Bradysia coprophila TaxID=38358 RepID=UPI00187DCE6F|nr:uncharacterized protein LOC119069353 isoform X2 [Bradysia coprophila]